MVKRKRDDVASFITKFVGTRLLVTVDAHMLTILLASQD